MKPIILAVHIIAIVALIIGTYGFTSLFNSPTATPTATSGQASQVQQYADAFHNFTLSARGPNESISGWQQRMNGSNAMVIKWADTNIGIIANGTQTNFSMNLEQFPSTAAASSFYNDTSDQCCTPPSTGGAVEYRLPNFSRPWDLMEDVTNPPQDVYKQTTGNSVIVANGATGINNGREVDTKDANGQALYYSYVTDFDFIAQQNEFVYWGTAHVQPLPSQNNTSSTPPQAAQHDALLERYLTAYQQIYKDDHETIDAWEVTWNNSTTADITFSGPQYPDHPGSMMFGGSVKVVHFASVDDATNYLNSFNKTYYDNNNTVYKKGSDWPADAYTNVTGHAPSVYKHYYRSGGSTTTSVGAEEIYQYDTFVFTGRFYWNGR